jgi:mannose/fructose/N-acetylgalactosamine-specific phosphotransferase system component IIC
MLPEASAVIVLVLLGAWAGIDSTSTGQFMVSRPVVSASLAGWAAGDPTAGALIGLILEAINLTVLPVGAARYPEIGPAAVISGAVYALSPQDGAALVACIGFAIAWAWVGGISVRYLRQMNCHIAAPFGDGEGTEPRLPVEALERRHLFAVGVDFARAGLLVLLGLPLLFGFQAATRLTWALPEGLSSIVIWSVVAASIAATIRLFGGRRIALLTFGFVCGSVLLVLA